MQAKRQGVRVMLDLASWETVKSNLKELREILEEGLISCCVANEDEAQEIVPSKDSQSAKAWEPRASLLSLLSCCDYAIVTLGSKGCIAACKSESGTTVWTEPAVEGVKVVDCTGAGDAFSSGFLYGLLRGQPLAKCANIGCLAGAAVVQAVGAELGPSELQWLHQRMHSQLAAAVVSQTAGEVRRRASGCVSWGVSWGVTPPLHPALAQALTLPHPQVYQELLDAYALISRIGVGAVYFGSARIKEDSKYWSVVMLKIVVVVFPN